VGPRERPNALTAALFFALFAGGCATTGETVAQAPEAPIVRPGPPGPNYAVIVAKVDSEGTDELRFKRLLVPETVDATKAAMMLMDIAPDVQFGGPPHPCYEILVVLRSGSLELESGAERVTLGPGDAVVLRRRTPFLVRGAGGDPSQALLVFVPDGVTVAECDALASEAAPVESLPADPARPILRVAHLADAAPHEIAGGHGEARLLLDPATPSGSSLAYLGTLRGDEHLVVPEHVHAGAAELLLLVGGRGEMTIAGTVVPVSAGMAIHVPPDTPHSFRATRAIDAIQVYAPAGAEDRFRQAPTKTP